jgi:hypothetical protein
LWRKDVGLRVCPGWVDLERAARCRWPREHKQALRWVAGAQDLRENATMK